jgi:hypothetical protein
MARTASWAASTAWKRVGRSGASMTVPIGPTMTLRPVPRSASTAALTYGPRLVPTPNGAMETSATIMAAPRGGWV